MEAESGESMYVSLYSSHAMRLCDSEAKGDNWSIKKKKRRNWKVPSIFGIQSKEGSSSRIKKNSSNKIKWHEMERILERQENEN